MHERAGTWPSSISPLRVFALVLIAGAIFLNTEPYIGLLTNTPKSDKAETIAETPPAPDKPAVRVVAHAEVQSTKPESATTTAWLQPTDASPAPKDAKPTRQPNKEKSISAEALPIPRPASKQGSAILTFTVMPLPVPIRRRVRAAIPRSEAPPLPTRAPKKVESRIAGSTHHQMGQASWYSLDSVTASGEKMDDAALTAAHNFLPLGTKVLIENVANGRSVVVRINDRGPFAAGRIIDLSKAAAKALDFIAAGVTDVRLSVIHQIEDLKSGAMGWVDEKALASTIRTASVDPESKPVRRNSQGAKVDPESKSAKHQKRAVSEIGTPATSTTRTASVDPDSKPIRRNGQAAKVDPESKSAKHKKRAVSEIGTPTTSAPAPVVKHQPRGLFGGMKLADGRESVFRGFLKTAFGNHSGH